MGRAEECIVTRYTNWLSLAGFVLICLGVAGLGALATTPEIGGWYQGIEKPSWNPPNWIFGPVWTTLYVMMAVAAWRIWKKQGWNNRGLALFGLQLVLNLAWSWIFFRLHQPGWAAVEIVLLWLAIAATIRVFLRHDSIAGWLLAPYLAWVSFATALNVTIWRLNS